MKNIIVPIVPRKMKFELEKHSTQDWCCNDLLISAYMNGVSLALPIGEHFFIKSIKLQPKDSNPYKNISNLYMKKDFAKYNLNEAKDNLGRTTIYAPADGTISVLNVELGERVLGTQQNDTGKGKKYDQRIGGDGRFAS